LHHSINNTPSRPKTRNKYYCNCERKRRRGLAKKCSGDFTTSRVSSPEQRITLSLKQTKKKNMKNKILTSLIGTSLALAVAVAVWSPVNSSAQVKGAQLLMSQSAALAAESTAPAMACAKCTTQFTSRADATVRGAVKPVAITATHQCASCDTADKTVGTGKGATTVMNHTCTMGGDKPATCCN
jgi:hypothetical protein